MHSAASSGVAILYATFIRSSILVLGCRSNAVQHARLRNEGVAVTDLVRSSLASLDPRRTQPLK